MAGQASAQTAPGAPITPFPAAFFAPAQPYSALDMVARLPGFTLDLGDAEVRGLSGSTGNVLVDGQRPNSKQETLDAILRRIPAAAVERIELIRPGAPGIDMQGAPLLANVVRRAEAVTLVRVEGQTKLSAGGRMAPMLAAQLSRRESGRLLEASVKAGREVNDRKGDGIRRWTNALGEIDRAANYHELEDPDLAEATLGYERPVAGGKLRVDLLARRKLTRAGIVETVTTPSPSVLLISEWERLNTRELGVRYQRPMSHGWRLDTLGLVRDADTRARDAASAQGSLTVAGEAADAREAILRAALQRDGSATTVTLGVEGASNRLRGRNSLVEQGRPVALPTTDVFVVERRAEAFATGVWRPSDWLTLEGGARYEVSELSQRGAQRSARSLRYLKPRVLAAVRLNSHSQLRVEIERRVGQLDFDVFVTSASLSTGTVSAGNPDIRPDRTWRSSATWERTLGKTGSLVVTARHDAISDAIDRTPVRDATGDFDAPGNIGDGTRDELSVATIFGLQRFGVAGGQLKAEALWRRSSVTDPTTGRSRAISGEANRTGSLQFTQDLPAWRVRWGADLSLPEVTPRAMFNEVRRDQVQPRLGAFVEYRPTPAWNIRVRADNLTDARLERTRELYAGRRDGVALNRRELRSIGYGPYFGLSIERALSWR